MRDSGVPATRFPVRAIGAGGNGPVQLDEMSKAIIEKLQQDGRRSYAAIGKAVGLSEAAVRQRVQRLAGRLDIESEPGGGTAISATVPAIPAGG